MNIPARRPRKTRNKKIPIAQAKKLVLDELRAGHSVRVAMASVQRTTSTYHAWRDRDKEFGYEVERIRTRANLIPQGPPSGEVPDFPEFCEKILGMPLPRHQMRAWEVINGKNPDDITPTMLLQWSGKRTNNRRIILNFPPEHAKSTVWTVQYVTWLIYRNPNIRVIVLSKTESLAEQFVDAVRNYLMDQQFEELRKLDPPGGWRTEDGKWSRRSFFVAGRTGNNPDPTVQALGLGQQIYGRRCDVIIADDIETIDNYMHYESHAKKVSREANSRLRKSSPDGSDPGGLLLVLGTRVGPVDLYSYLRDEMKDYDGNPAFTYFKQPAILEGEHLPPEQWQVLWPEVQHPGAIASEMAMNTPQMFQLVFQQNDVPDIATFPQLAVMESVNDMRWPGLLDPKLPGHPEHGLTGCRVVGGIDPASNGGTAIVIAAVHGLTMKRYILEVYYERDMHIEDFISKVKHLTDRYNVVEWRVERNAFQRSLLQLEVLTQFMAQRGVLWTPHTTTEQSKWDVDWGVESLRPLFLASVAKDGDGWRKLLPGEGYKVIELPTKRDSHVHILIKQLTTWAPGNSKVPSDCVMALWFAEIAMREYLLGRRMDAASKPREQRFVSPFMESRRPKPRTGPENDLIRLNKFYETYGLQNPQGSA